jgi:hypothetical protein
MNSIDRLHLIEKLRDLTGRLSCITKEVTTTDVPGILTVREDLGIRTGKKHPGYLHGQKHAEPQIKNRVTAPSGAGMSSISNTPFTSMYAEWNPGERM